MFSLAAFLNKIRNFSIKLLWRNRPQETFHPTQPPNVFYNRFNQNRIVMPVKIRTRSIRTQTIGSGTMVALKLTPSSMQSELFKDIPLWVDDVQQFITERHTNHKVSSAKSFTTDLENFSPSENRDDISEDNDDGYCPFLSRCWQGICDFICGYEDEDDEEAKNL